jgi:NAD(P)-dependent dehydrogenase (short-subunit alcohol dehydrogenase family)
MKKLENKVAVVTGGNSGIGLATGKLFAEQGARVAITGRSRATLNSAAETIGEGAISIVSDVSDLSSIKTAYKEISAKLGKIDVLVVNAGVDSAAPLADFTEELFDHVSDINFKGAFFSVQLALPYLNDGASVIFTSSALNEKGYSTYSAYAATKAAVRSLARSFSNELLTRNIRVNVLSPGAIDTPIYGRSGGSKEEVAGVKDYMATNMIPLKRLGTSEEIAEGFLYLASDASKYMVGSELVMDGGVKTL